MNSPPDQPTRRGAAPTFEPDATCDTCGAFGAVAFDGIRLCVSCYAERGSCCTEFGAAPETDVPGSAPSRPRPADAGGS